MKSGLSRKDELYNDLLSSFQCQLGLDFPYAVAKSEGAHFIQVRRIEYNVPLLNCVFYRAVEQNNKIC